MGVFGAWFARILVESEVRQSGLSRWPPQGVEAHYKLLKKSSLRVFQFGCRRGHGAAGQVYGRNRKLLGNRH